MQLQRAGVSPLGAAQRAIQLMLLALGQVRTVGQVLFRGVKGLGVVVVGLGREVVS